MTIKFETLQLGQFRSLFSVFFSRGCTTLSKLMDLEL